MPCAVRSVTSEEASAPVGDFLFAEIPADAIPETVLSQLAKLN